LAFAKVLVLSSRPRAALQAASSRAAQMKYMMGCT
jgi:hypothetical protein